MNSYSLKNIKKESWEAKGSHDPLRTLALGEIFPLGRRLALCSMNKFFSYSPGTRKTDGVYVKQWLSPRHKYCMLALGPSCPVSPRRSFLPAFLTHTKEWKQGRLRFTGKLTKLRLHHPNMWVYEQWGYQGQEQRGWLAQIPSARSLGTFSLCR